MKVLFSASEVGSARALIPLMDQCLDNCADFFVTQCGYFADLDDDSLVGHLIELQNNLDEIQQYLTANDITLVVFSVNVHDTLPLAVARAAHKLNIPTMHILDYWNAYAERMQLDGCEMFIPSMYVVPDELAANAAGNEGISGEIIKVAGQPALHDLRSSLASIKNVSNKALTRFQSGKSQWIVFVSEPVAIDQGNSLAENKHYRGYTEGCVLELFLKVFLKLAFRDQYKIAVLPHPREDIVELQMHWRAIGGEEYGYVIDDIRGRECLPYVEGVVGMSSTLLYESWLIGLPVLSLQPGLLNNSLRMMQSRENVSFVDQYENFETITNSWLSNLPGKKLAHNVNSELFMHEQAPQRIYELMRSLSIDKACKETV